MLKIIRKTLMTGSQTRNYPKEPEAAPVGFRGKPELVPERCTYCGECVSVCPPGVIWLTEEKSEKTLTLSYCGCIFCGRCEEVCPNDAIRLTQEYELSSKTKDDLLTSIKRKL